MYKYKVCNKCRRILPKTTDFFFKHKLSKDGLESQCKECVKKRRRKRYKNVIYEIYCKETNIYYIGQTIKPITERMSKHFSDAKGGREQPLYVDIRKYGKEAFEYKVLEIIENKEHLDDKERYYIRKYLDEGKRLYNREYGGRKNIIVNEETKIIMSRNHGIDSFLVFDSGGYFLGEFNTISEANKKLGYFNYSKYMDNTYLNSKDYIVISKKNFTYDLLVNEIKAYTYLEDNIRYNEETYYKGTHDVRGKKNPMYNKHGKDNPNSKRVYIIKDNKIIDVFESATQAQESYNFEARAYARGECNHYYRKKDLYVYYENLLPIIFRTVRHDKDDESYN